MTPVNTTSDKTRQLLAFSLLPGVGPATLRKVAAVKGFEAVNPLDLRDSIAPLRRVLPNADTWNGALRLAEEQERQSQVHTVRILSPLDADYPDLLRSSPNDPFILYVKGQLAPAPEHSVAVIGTRKATADGLLIAEKITRFFVENHWSVVSGLAPGCDAQAHRSALAANGHTVAVLAHGLQTIAPIQHKDLASQILDAGGALISQFPMGSPAMPKQFVTRDKTQAGLSQGVIMVQSNCQGGSLHASRAALKYNRWLAVPCPTAKDRNHPGAKIEANLVLCEGQQQEKLALLHLKEAQALRHLIVLRNQADYSNCLEKQALSNNTDSASRQPRLF